MRAHVKAALLDRFSNRALPDGRLGFFHPDKLSFGQGVYLSALVAAARRSTASRASTSRGWSGSSKARRASSTRACCSSARSRSRGSTTIPSFPEHGRLAFTLRGGR